MKIYALYYNDAFVAAFPSREDCIKYGKTHYAGYEWDCNIVERYLSSCPISVFDSNKPIEDMEKWKKEKFPYKIKEPYKPYFGPGVSPISCSNPSTYTIAPYMNSKDFTIAQ